jgi:predicted transglutaminase-like cysteine proteinase
LFSRLSIFMAICVGASCFGVRNTHAASVSFGPPEPTAFAPAAASLDRPPAGWADYCIRHEDDCQLHIRQPLRVMLTHQVFDRLTATNVAINHVVRPMTDMEHWGVEDHWDQAEDSNGDCEDYQLLKRKLLVEAGVPRRAMLLTVVRDEDGNGHATLMVRTNLGDVILDNETDEILLWKDTGYSFMQRESQYRTGWVDIEKVPERAMHVAATQLNLRIAAASPRAVVRTGRAKR